MVNLHRPENAGWLKWSDDRERGGKELGCECQAGSGWMPRPRRFEKSGLRIFADDRSTRRYLGRGLEREVKCEKPSKRFSALPSIIP